MTENVTKRNIGCEACDAAGAAVKRLNEFAIHDHGGDRVRSTRLPDSSFNCSIPTIDEAGRRLSD
jgi:hypothetical protein